MLRKRVEEGQKGGRSGKLTVYIYIGRARVREERGVDSRTFGVAIGMGQTTTNATTGVHSVRLSVSSLSLSLSLPFPLPQISQFSLSHGFALSCRLFPLVIKDHEPQLRLIQCQGLNAYALPYWRNFLSWPTQTQITFIWNSTLALLN